MKNTDLKQTYDEMHETGKSAWFDDGQAERQAIFTMGEPWESKAVLEIGCGEGDLLNMIYEAGAADACGMDFSENAIEAARKKHPDIPFRCGDIKVFIASGSIPLDVLIMQGVLEHLDSPLKELTDMIARFKPKTVITSMPGFLNPRGIIWHTLDMLGAVMSKTDLHFIDPWQVEAFCSGNGYKLTTESIEHDWAAGVKMIEDLRQRLPLALADGNIPFKKARIERLFKWLEQAHHRLPTGHDGGAVIIYRIEI